MKHLISLADHNKSISEGVADPILNESRPNGIACPKCQAELLDVTPNLVLPDFPPLQKAVRCPKCGWYGQRLA
jgi:uncharacterized protein with PIN domain